MTNRFVFGALALVSLSGCLGGGGGGAADSGSSNSVLISGVLSLSNTSSSFQKTLMMSKNGDSDIDGLAVSDYTATCATATVPPEHASAAVSADGSFGLTVANAKNKPMSCSLVNTSDGTKAADFIVEDTSNKDLNGNSDRSTTMTPSGNLALSTITLDAATGEVTVPKTTIASAVTETVTGTVYDPTGTWTIGDVDFDLPDGVRGVCSAAEQAAHTCSGPPDGQAIHLKRWTGVKSSTGATVYGLQVWQSQSGFTTCGSRIGLTATQKTDIGVDFSQNGVADAEFVYPGTVTYTDNVLSAVATSTLTDGWMQSNATSRYNMNPNCGPVDLTINGTTYSNAWRCGPDGNSMYQVGLSGGCTVTATGKPAEITDWSNINNCQSATDANGIQTNTCTGTATVNSVANTAVSCTNKWVVVNNTNAVQANGSFDWNTMAGDIPSGTACSGLPNGTDPQKLTRLRCFADYYWQSGLSNYQNACMPRINMDWSATDPNEFVKKDTKPNSLIFFEQFKPFPDGTGGSITSRQEHYQGVNVDGTSWVNCNVIDTGALTIKKVSDTRMLATYQSSEVTSSTAKPACMAKFTGKKVTFMFYVNK